MRYFPRRQLHAGILDTRSFASHPLAMKQLTAVFFMFTGGIVPVLAAKPANPKTTI